MPHTAIEHYMSNLEKNQAIFRMMLGEAAKLPHLDEDDRRAWANDIEEKIIGMNAKPRITSLGALKNIGVGVHIVKE